MRKRVLIGVLAVALIAEIALFIPTIKTNRASVKPVDASVAQTTSTVDASLTTAIPTEAATTAAVTTTAVAATTSVTTTAATDSNIYQPAAEYDPSIEAYADKMYEEVLKVLKTNSVNGMTLVVFKNGNILYKQHYGMADKANKIPVNDNTKFRMGSISKHATGIIAMQLVEQGKLNLDADISDYLGVKIRAPGYPDTKITPRMLMSHTSSIVDSEHTFTGQYSLDGLVGVGLEFTGARPGRRFVYSNLAAGMMGGIIEKVTGEHFVDYAQNLFKSMDIDAAYVRDFIVDQKDIAVCYDQWGNVTANPKTWNRTSANCRKTPLGKQYNYSQSDLMISALDFTKFAMMHLNNGTYNGVKILSPESDSEMNSKQFGLNWGIMTKISISKLREGRTLYGHNGQAYGCCNACYYDPTDDSGLVFFNNGTYCGKNSHGEYSVLYDMTNAVYDTILDNV